MENGPARDKSNLILRVAAVFASLSAVLIVWSFLDPPNHDVPFARLVGQLFGTLAFVAFNYVVATVERPSTPAWQPQGTAPLAAHSEQLAHVARSHESSSGARPPCG